MLQRSNKNRLAKSLDIWETNIGAFSSGKCSACLPFKKLFQIVSSSSNNKPSGGGGRFTRKQTSKTEATFKSNKKGNKNMFTCINQFKNWIKNWFLYPEGFLNWFQKIKNVHISLKTLFSEKIPNQTGRKSTSFQWETGKRWKKISKLGSWSYQSTR